MTWKLQTITGEFAGTEVAVDREMLVGRHQEANVLIQSADVSRKHAMLKLQDQLLFVQDLGSSNGTFINDVRIGEGYVLVKDGDILQFAGHKFSVLAPAEVITSTEKTIAAQMQDQGMPDLKDRDQSVQLSRDGMPQNVGVPKPAPIPEGVDVTSAPRHEACEVNIPDACSIEEAETQKNANIGLIAVMVLVVVGIIAWLIFN